MEAGKLKQIEEIYHAALAIPVAEREAFFAKSCGADENLRREVESLLAFENASDEFIDSSPESLAAEMLVERENNASLVGRVIGHYKIKHLLGKGGMGEVYLAEDARLNRKVALKLLSTPICDDKNLLRRFEQEAFAASALNHPNILTIYEFEAKGEVCYLATEYIEGETLREHSKNNLMSLQSALDAAIQMASALCAAHSAGIVHRDIKPDNVMIRPDGLVKILDFGIVKMSADSEFAASENPESEAATTIIKGTVPGMIIGTANYMSPEQARGREVDARTDIFSFGVVLYEMLSGKSPFEGETAIDTIAAILHKEPIPLNQLLPELPAEFEQIVNRTLLKNADERYQNIKDVLTDLRSVKQRLVYEEVGRSFPSEKSKANSKKQQIKLFDSSVSGQTMPAIEPKELLRARESASIESSISPVTNAELHVSTSGNQTITIGDEPAASTAESVAPSTSSAENPVGEAKKHKMDAGVVIALLALVVAGVSYSVYRLTAQRDKPARSLQTAKFTRLTTTGKASGVAVSPDGKYVVHIEDAGGQQSLWIRQVATQSNVQIVAPAATTYSGLTFSPDGNYIYYTAFSQELAQPVLFQVPPLGGTPKKLLENVTTLPVTFSPDGKQLAFVRPSPREEFTLMIANADGTEERKIAQYQNPPESISAPAWSPDGKRIAYRLGNFESNDSNVFETQIADGSTRALTTQRWLGIGGLAWLADGSGLLMRATSGRQFVYQIWHLSYPEGEARQITNDLNNYLGMSLAADSSTLAVVQSQQQASIWVAPASDPSRARPITSGSGKADTSLAWTPDGRIVYQSNASGNDDIWITDSDGSGTKQLTTNARINQVPEVSPDGHYIVFITYRTGVPHIWRMNIDGSDQRQLANGASGESSARFSPDGRWLVYRTALGRWTVWKMPADGSGEPLQLTDKYSRSPIVSPDGKLIAYFYREDDGPWRIAVAPFEGGEPLRTFDIPALPNSSLRWMPDNRAVAYVVTQGGVSNIVAQPLDGGKPKQLTDFKQERIFSFDYSPDGKQLALSRGTINNDVVLISNFK